MSKDLLSLLLDFHFHSVAQEVFFAYPSPFRLDTLFLHNRLLENSG
jgi:hypothetical protein